MRAIGKSSGLAFALAVMALCGTTTSFAEQSNPDVKAAPPAITTPAPSASTLAPAAASDGASKRVAVLPADLSFPRTEEDFYYGVKKASPDEQRRLDMIRDELRKFIKSQAKYEEADLAGLEKDIDNGRPFYDCNGCETDIAGKAKADLVFTSMVDKISETHLSLTIGLIDVATSKMVKQGSVLIQGNTDEAWAHAMRWVLRERFKISETQR